MRYTPENCSLAKEEFGALVWHLEWNVFPGQMCAFGLAVQAIDAARSGYWQREILLPDGSTQTTREIVETLHLEEFC